MPAAIGHHRQTHLQVSSVSAVFSIHTCGIPSAYGGIVRQAMWKILLILFILGASEANGQQARAYYGADGPGTPTRDDKASEAPNSPKYRGKPLSYWLTSIQNRDGQMGLAFDAIRTLGPAASSAVPDLTSIVSEPFIPIKIGVDGYSAVTHKLSQIQLHSDAVDCLAAIGESAAPSATALTEWALTTKVIPVNIRNKPEQDAFVDLVAMDVLERMRVAGAIARFLPEASLVVANLLKSHDEEATKLAVAILSDRALPLATALLKSKKCGDQKMGMEMITDMWPVVARDHLLDLNEILPCMQPEKH